MADYNEAMRLADDLDRQWSDDALNYDTAREAAALIRQQADRIAELEKEIADLHTTMFAAAAEIHEHWDAHCDAEGYGPANLMHRLERGIASQYGYDAKTLQRVEAERDTLRAEVERLRVEVSANRERDALKIAGLHIHAELRSIVNAGGSDEVIGREFRKRVLPNIEDEVVKLRDEVKRLREADGWRGRDDVKHSQIGLADALADWGFSVHDDDEGRTWLTIRNPDDDIARVSVATVWPLNGNQTIGAVVLHQLDSALAKARSQRSQA